MLLPMSFRNPKDWAREQAEKLRSDPKGWAREQADKLKDVVDVAPFSDEALEVALAGLRERMARLERLDSEERQVLTDEVIALHERLATGNTVVNGAKIGLAAAVLPVIGVITGPLLGGAYGVYRSQQLRRVRDELQDMLRALARR